QSAREKEQLTQKIIYLETEINAKEKEIAFLKQTLFGTDKDIADLKGKLSQLKQTVQRTQSDFVKQMASIDKKLQEAKKNIAELEGGFNFTVQKNKTEVEESRSKPQIFNGKAYFDLQQSWFDTPSNNGGCFRFENFPVSAKDLETIRNVKSTSRAFTEQAKGMKKKTCKDYFDLQPSWFDSLSQNAGCLEVENVPVKGKDLEAMKNAKSNSKAPTSE
ncbi:unnamed protein product, partial [Pocillopora meandrina]